LAVPSFEHRGAGLADYSDVPLGIQGAEAFLLGLLGSIATLQYFLRGLLNAVRVRLGGKRGLPVKRDGDIGAHAALLVAGKQ
jgi:hypothetical protein